MVQSSKDTKQYSVKTKSSLVPLPRGNHSYVSSASFWKYSMYLCIYSFFFTTGNYEPCVFHSTMQIVIPENYI